MRWALVALVCLGVWLHAADALVATTVMPSAIAEIGGLPYIYWTIALYELGSIIAGAVTGVASVSLGLRAAMVTAALAYALGCGASALAPSMGVMLAGRLVQGLGGGAMLALSYVGTSQLFPERLWTRVLALVSGVWGVSSLVGPLVGGAFASAGLWCGAFWAFGAQALLVVMLTPLLVGRRPTRAEAADEIPTRQIAALSIGVLATAAAGVQTRVDAMVALVVVGLAALALVLRLEEQARARLLPPTPFSGRVPWGAGYTMVLALATATVSFTVYGPLLMARLFGVGPLTAGFMVAAESVAWTLAALAFARATPRHEPALIRSGAGLVTAGLVALALTMPRGPGLGAPARRRAPGRGFRHVLGVRAPPHRRQRPGRRARARVGRDADAPDDRLRRRRGRERDRRQLARPDRHGTGRGRAVGRVLGICGVLPAGPGRRGGRLHDGPGPATQPASWRIAMSRVRPSSLDSHG
jgi:MFS family permease